MKNISLAFDSHSLQTHFAKYFLKIHKIISFKDTSIISLRHATPLTIVCLLLLAFWNSTPVQAQSLQWSQYTSPNPTSRAQHWTVAVEVAADGSIYTLTDGRTSSATPPIFPTTDVVYYGNFSNGNSGANRFVYVSKYSPDGSNLEWVRVLAPEAPTNGGVNSRPFDLEISPATGEVVVLTIAGGGPIASDLITNDAQFPNPPPVFDGWTGANNQTLVINKFSPSGALVYGSYFAKPEGGTYILFPEPVAAGYPQSLEISEDGSIYASFRVDIVDQQTGIIPTTAGALSTTLFSTPNTVGSFFTILNPDNSVRYATYWIDRDTTNGGIGAYEGKIAPNGDYYVLLNSMDEGLIGYTSTSVIDPNTNGTLLIRVNSSGTIIGDTYIPNQANELVIRPNGNVIASDTEGNLYEYNEELTSLINQTTPFPNGLYGRVPSDIELDEEGRIHFVTFYLSDEGNTFSTVGALSTADDGIGGYYGILDCNLQDIVYSTKIESTNPFNANDWMILYDMEVVGCTAYMVGQSRTGIDFPVTPTAFNDDGTASVSGYNISPAATTGGNWRDGVLMAFNYPVLETNTNVLTAPALSTFCLGSAILPIEGTESNFLTPSVIGNSDANPVSTPTHYQWEVATSVGGPWTIIADSNKEDFSPEAPATAGDYFYRRTVRQTPFEMGFCEPACDVQDVSNVIQLTFTNDVTHTTDIPEDPYAICANMSSLSLAVNITPSIDGENGPYDYKLTTTANLVDIALGQSGSVVNTSTPINLSVNTAGDYILQVADSRGCVSFDTLFVENLNLDAGAATKFTCGEATVQVGPISLPPDYVNFPTNSFAWSPTTGLDNPNGVSPILTHGLAVGDSTTLYLTFNGCLVDSVKVIHETVAPLPALPNISVCQGDTIRLGTSGQGTASLLTEEANLTYEWAPGLGLTENDVVNPIVTTIYAPQGVNPINYILLATAGSTGCISTTTQELTTYRYPNQSFNVKDILQIDCPENIIQYGAFGTEPEPGISYSWTATVEDDPTNVGTTGLPTDAEALSFLVNPTSSKTTLNSVIPGLGYASTPGYKITYVRTSFNTADPTCMRTDTTELYYPGCPGGGGIMCELALGNVPTIGCGGPDNEIGPISSSASGDFYWSRVDGQPLNNELFEIDTNAPLSTTGPHPYKVIGNPSGFVAVDYRLMFVRSPRTGSTFDTCSVDIRVFPGAIATPNIDYASPQAVCEGTPYTVQGPAEQPAYEYLWSPTSMLETPADSTIALPTIIGLDADASAIITVTDPFTACFVVDTVAFVITAVELDAGVDNTFCSGGTDLDIGGFEATLGYTYQWTAVPSAGVSFGDATAAKTTVTLPATTDGNEIKLYLTATNGLTAANCMLTDSIIMTAADAPTIVFPTISELCAGGEITIGPISPTAASFNWSGPGIVSGQGTDEITVNATDIYSVTVTQGTCVSTEMVTVVAPTDPTVDLAPAAACASDVTIGAVSMTSAQKTGWSFTWDKLDALTANATDFSTITVRPATTTTYTLTATHNSGCVQTFPVVVPAAVYAAELPYVFNFCEGAAAQLTLNDFSGVGGSVVWTADPVAGESYLSSTTAAQPTIDMIAAENGQYTYTATVSYPTGCVSIASAIVNIGKMVENIAGFDREICQGECIQLGTSRISGVNYNWMATPADLTLTSTLIAEPTVCPTENTIYTLTYFSASGCVYTDEVSTQVQTSPTLTVTDTVAICQNEAGTATLDLSTAISTNTGISTTYWQNADLTIATSPAVTYPGLYYIKSGNVEGCSVSASTEVMFYDLPQGTVTTDFDCTTNTGSLSISSSDTDIRYDYNTGTTYTGGNTYATATVLATTGATISNLPAPTFGEQTYTVRFFGADGVCFVDKIVILSSAACPCPENNYTFCVGAETYTLTATTGLTDIQWQVDNGSGFVDITDSTNMTLVVSAPGTYRYTAKDIDNCDVVVCCPSTFTAESCDWGDLPDVTNATAMDDYQTLGANEGPVHKIITGLSLGATVDGETDGNPSNDALGDGADEDGIMLFASLDLSPGLTFRLPFSYVNMTGETAHVEAWIDWNADGAFDGTDEMVINWDDSAGILPDRMEITIPQNAQTGSQLGWRIRISNQDNMTPYGVQPNGEIEDYLIGIDCPQVCLPIKVTIVPK